MFKNQNLLDIFTEQYRSNVVFLLLNFFFTEFKKILIFVKQDHSENFNENSLKKRLLAWLRHYLRIEPKNTPYIHKFVFHSPEFILKYKN